MPEHLRLYINNSIENELNRESLKTSNETHLYKIYEKCT